MQATTLDFEGKMYMLEKKGERGKRNAPLLFGHCAAAFKLSAIHLKLKTFKWSFVAALCLSLCQFQRKPHLTFSNLSHKFMLKSKHHHTLPT